MPDFSIFIRTTVANLVPIVSNPDFTSRGITFDTSPPYTHQLNGLAERSIRTVNDIARCLMIESGLPANLLGEMVSTAVDLDNRRPKANLGYVSPVERQTGSSPDLSLL